MKYVVCQGVSINQPGRKLVHGEKFGDGDLSAKLISELLAAEKIVRDEPEPARRRKDAEE